MAQIMLQLNNNYEIQRRYLRMQGDVLLQRIKMLEIKMNRIKQQNQPANQQNINSLNAMVKKLLRMLAKINTYQFFENRNEQWNCVNGIYFNQICDNHFENLIQSFIRKLKLRGLQRLQRLQHLQSLQRLRHFEPVDFEIWQ